MELKYIGQVVSSAVEALTARVAVLDNARLEAEREIVSLKLALSSVVPVAGTDETLHTESSSLGRGGSSGKRKAVELRDTEVSDGGGSASPGTPVRRGAVRKKRRGAS